MVCVIATPKYYYESNVLFLKLKKTMYLKISNRYFILLIQVSLSLTNPCCQLTYVVSYLLTIIARCCAYVLSISSRPLEVPRENGPVRRRLARVKAVPALERREIDVYVGVSVGVSVGVLRLR